jgi:tetratricopeptide (TPR) repeat protein
VGRREEALAAEQEAVAIRRELAQASPGAYLPDLAGSLNNLGNRLGAVGRREEALAAVQEAVAIRRELAQASPDAYLPNLATSLSNLGNHLGEVGRREEALAAVQEAVAIRRELAQASPDAYLADLATSLNNMGSHLGEVGRREEALAAVQEAVAIRRELAQASPGAYLPDLATSLSNLAGLLSDAGRADEAEGLLSEILNSLADSPLGTGHILLARGRWLLSQDRLGDAVADLTAAVAAFTGARDRLMCGQARQLLCELRQADRSALDTAWSQTQETMPIWLQHPATDDELADAVIGWVRTPDWTASRTYLDGHAAALLTDEAEAALEHLIDYNPISAELEEHLMLLRAARAHGVGSAYAAHQRQRRTTRLAQALEEWIRTPTWAQSQAFAAAHSDDLLDPGTMDILDTISDQDLGDRMFRLHRGLLGYAATVGFDAAYALRADTAQRRAELAAASDLQTSASTRLALARLNSGQSADDPEAHFQLATITLLDGKPDEAAAALTDCASNAAPYERRDFARRLREVTAGHPQLAAITGELEQLLLTAPDSTQADRGPDDAATAAISDTLTGLIMEWADTPSWKESQSFLASHSQELLTLSGHTALRQLATTHPEDENLALHVSLLRAVLAQGITAAYAQLRSELSQAQRADTLNEWISLAADPAASAAFLAGHSGDLNDPQAIALLATECEQQPDDPLVWRHLGLLLQGDQAADGYAAMTTGDPDPAQRAAALLDSGDLDQALAWACLARAADPGPGALLMAQIQLGRGDPDRARQALATATEQVSPGHLGEVLTAYDRLLAAQPGEAWLYAEHADALQRAGQPEAALAAYDQALSLAPGNPSLHFNKGHTLFGLSRMDEAEAELRIVIQLRPGDILGAAVLLAAIAWPTDTGQAEQHLQAALSSPGERLTPFTRAYFRAFALAGLGRADLAVSELEAAVPSRTGQESSLDDTDRMLLAQFSIPPLPGLEQLRRIIEPDPDDTQTQE